MDVLLSVSKSAASIFFMNCWKCWMFWHQYTTWCNSSSWKFTCFGGVIVKEKSFFQLILWYRVAWDGTDFDFARWQSHNVFLTLWWHEKLLRWTFSLTVFLEEHLVYLWNEKVFDAFCYRQNQTYVDVCFRNFFFRKKERYAVQLEAPTYA